MLFERIRGYLHHNDPDAGTAPADERRRAKRRSVLLRASIYPIDVFCDARVRDVSATGARGEVDVELAIGQTLHLTIDDQIFHSGTVRWTENGQFGLLLPNAAKLLADMSTTLDHGTVEGHQPRALRKKVNIPVRLLGGRPPRPAIVRNVSASGVSLETSPGLKPGQHLMVRIGTSPLIYGRVQWSEDDRVGLRALNAISVLAVTCAED